MHFHTAARTDVGLKRKLNEDSILERPEDGFWAVADGMGGHSRGDVASRTALEVVDAAIAPGAPTAVATLVEAVHAANAAVRALGSHAVTGTTLTVRPQVDGETAKAEQP